jgi:hypothetical protein
VRKNRPLSSRPVIAGDVDAGLTMTTPFGMATLLAEAMLEPEHSAPTIAATPSSLISLSADAVAAAESTQVVSASTASSVIPPVNFPDSLTSAIAILAPAAMPTASDSIGPVNPIRIPILTVLCANDGLDTPVASTSPAANAAARYPCFIVSSINRSALAAGVY